MKNTKLLPFDRNRYYTGKMLTSSDFQVEQSYNNNKRRFINSMILGSGIICGLSVRKMEDMSIQIDSGVALDAYGREIVIQEDTIKKLSAIEGFDNISTLNCRLYAAYDEKNIHPVYSASKKNKTDEFEYNRVQEGYRLYLEDVQEDRNSSDDAQSKDEYIEEAVIFKNDVFVLTLKTVNIVCINTKVRLLFELEKINEEDAKFEFTGNVQFPAYSTADGKHEKKISMEAANLKKGDVLRKEIWVNVDNIGADETNVIFKKIGAQCRINDELSDIETDAIIKVSISELEPEKVIDEVLGHTSYEKRNIAANGDVALAEIVLKKTITGYEIDSISEKKVKTYIETIASQSKRAEYLRYFSSFYAQEDNINQVVNTQQVNGESDDNGEITTGIVEVPIGRRFKKGEVFFSDEIVHGLGKGDVYIRLGAKPNVAVGVKQEDITVFGNSSIFGRDISNYMFDTAIKVNNDKGSFVVGVRALENSECSVVKYRWFATGFKKEKGFEEEKTIDRGIIAETPTVVLGPGESHYFGVRFNNMEQVQLGYETTDAFAGKISVDGIYTAPMYDGVYEIRIFCLNDPTICTYAYAIVKREG